MIEIARLTKRFSGTIAVDCLTLHVAAGEAVALHGANGAGKSTIIRCVLGLLHYEGRILIGGHDARTQGKQARRLVGYVPQELGFNDDLRVSEAVRLFAILRGERRVDVEATLGSVGLTGHERKCIRHLSGGMKQRLAVALALLGDPPALVLDEVTASLDAEGRAEFRDLLGRLNSDGKTLLFASHREEEVEALATRIVSLKDGQVVLESRTRSSEATPCL